MCSAVPPSAYVRLSLSFFFHGISVVREMRNEKEENESWRTKKQNKREVGAHRIVCLFVLLRMCVWRCVTFDILLLVCLSRPRIMYDSAPTRVIITLHMYTACVYHLGVGPGRSVSIKSLYSFFFTFFMPSSPSSSSALAHQPAACKSALRIRTQNMYSHLYARATVVVYYICAVERA